MLPSFDLAKPNTLQEACKLKEQGGVIVAGGTDIYVSMHGGNLRPEMLVDIKGLNELKGTEFDPETGLELGALTTHRFMEDSEIVKKYYPAVYEGCSRVGSVQTRYRGTLGGNICNAVPSADSVGPMLVYDAVCVVTGTKGERQIPLCEFFAGPKRTNMEPDEILTRIKLARPAKNSGSTYIKYTRRKAMDLALLGVAVYVESNQGTIEKARIALTTSAPTPMRAKAAEEYLTGKTIDENVIAKAAEIASTEASPRTSWRSSKEFRLKLIVELVQRAIVTAAQRAEEGAK